MNNDTLVQKFWGPCDILRDDGIAYLCTSSPQTRQLIVGDANSVSRVHNVNASERRSMPLALWPLAEQHEIIVRAHRLLLSGAEKVELQLSQAQREVENLTPATLAKAFRGELVAQDPADEPADKRLARIRAERATEAAAAPQRKGRQSARALAQMNRLTT